MAITHMDNFSIYGSTESLLLNGVYAENSSCTLEDDPDSVSSGKVLLVPEQYGGGGDYARLRFVLPANVTTSGQACRMWLAELPADSGIVPCPISFKNASNTFMFNLCVTTTGRLEVRSAGFAGSVLGATTNPVVSANGWYHIEMKVVIDTSAGSIEVRVEGQTVINLTSINTGSTPVSQVEICNDPTALSVGVSMYVKDFVVWDNTTAYNNNFLGSVIVYNLTPDADISLNWTPSTGSVGYSILDNIPPVDADYIYAPDPAPSPYVCTLTDLPVDVTSVKAIMTFVRAAKSDGGDGSLQVGVISDAGGTPTTGLGTDRPITVAQAYWRDVFQTDPDTSAAWLPSAVNAVRLQIDRTT